ncbi:MAG: TauD/TfdA dioxygenase family protein, partial [Reyranellaceae bacterium]
MRNRRLEVRLLSGAGGAEISGVDVAQDLDDDTIGEIRDALNEHCVVVFRDQALDVAQHKAFARRFGESFIHPNYVGTGDDPESVM